MVEYNPYDILKNEKACSQIHKITDKLSIVDGDTFYKEKIDSMVSNHVFWCLVGGTGILETAGAYLKKKHITNSLCIFQNEQLHYLNNNPWDIEEETKYNLIFSTLLWATYSRFIGVTESYKALFKLSYKMLKSLSFKRGIEEWAKDRHQKFNKIMWAAIENPICLLMNQLFVNNKTDFGNQINELCEELLIIGCKIDDMKELMDVPFNGLLKNKSIRQVVSDEFESIKVYAKKRQFLILKKLISDSEEVKNSLGTSEFEDYL